MQYQTYLLHKSLPFEFSKNVTTLSNAIINPLRQFPPDNMHLTSLCRRSF